MKRLLLATPFVLGLGCSSPSDRMVDYYTNRHSYTRAELIANRVNLEEFLVAVQDPRVDNLSKSEIEQRLEEQYNISIFGTPQDCEDDVLQLFGGVLRLYADAGIERIAGHTIIFASSANEEGIFTSPNYHKAGHYNATTQEMVFLIPDYENMVHELAHLLHVTHPQKDAIDSALQQIPIQVGDQTLRLDEVLGNEKLILNGGGTNYWADYQQGPRYGIASAYACTNIHEFVAEHVQWLFSTLQLAAPTGQHELAFSPNYDVANQVFAVLGEFGLVPASKRARWQVEYAGATQNWAALEGYLRSENTYTRKAACFATSRWDQSGVMANTMSQLVEDEDGVIRRVAGRYLRFSE